MPLEAGEKVTHRPGLISRMVGSDKPCVLRTVTRNEGWVLVVAVAVLAVLLLASLSRQ